MRHKKAELNPITIIVLIVIIGLVIFLGIRYFTKVDAPSLNITQINNTSVVPYTILIGGINITSGVNLTGTNKTILKIIYPNKTMTPGVIMSTNITEICVSGYSDRVRNVSQKVKDWVYLEYKLLPTQPEGSFQIDNLIPLSIGGSNDIKNLWPQPAEPKPGYKEKDILETYYHTQVCSGKMDLKEAQNIMATNWFSGYLNAQAVGGIK